MTRDFPAIGGVGVEVYEVPTDRPEADGTLAWSSTTVVVVRITADHTEGLGWTYAGPGCRSVVRDKLATVVLGADPMDVPRLNEAMVRACRNLGRPGIVSCAISAVDVALWDLKARLLDLPLTKLFGQVQDAVSIYGSGGFTTYDDATTLAQLERWTLEWRIPRVKIKIGESWGTDPDRDLHRVEMTRQAVGPEVDLYVDANGAYGAKQAIRLGRTMVSDFGVSWFEEPVSSDELAGLRQVRDHCTADVTAGEYGYGLAYFAQMLNAEAVDCLQIDVTRCGGYTEWLRAAYLASGHGLQVSAHCAPNLHAPVAATVTNLRHIEYFHDHHCIETQLFDGALCPQGGALSPDLDRQGHGLILKPAEAARYRTA
jgi:L-alanine-DL-glutamate epimerase-like enolase superfamily enzyme